ncbi:MAG: ATP phosphoribosyltransferase [Thermoleophilaceae bacterium]
MSDLTIAVPRGALFAGTLDRLDAPRPRHRRGPRQRPQAALPRAGIVTMRPSDVPTYVEAGAADLGITGKDVLMEQSEREVYELLDLGYGECRMVLATVAGPDLASEALRRLGVMRVATKYPQDRGRLAREHRSPGGDRRGQGLGRARAADRAGGGDRRPHRDGHDASRERAGHPRGDRHVHRAPHRQPGRPQAQGRGDRRRPGGASVRVERAGGLERLNAASAGLERRADRSAPLALRVRRPDGASARRRRASPRDPRRTAISRSARAIAPFSI